MRGLADAHTATGVVQRVLADADGWLPQSEIHWRAMQAGEFYSLGTMTLSRLLERLVREGRAEHKRDYPPDQMGSRDYYRAPQAVTERDHVIGDDTISIDYAKED